MLSPFPGQKRDISKLCSCKLKCVLGAFDFNEIHANNKNNNNTNEQGVPRMKNWVGKEE